MKLIVYKVLVLMLCLFPTAHAESVVNLNFSYGVGPRHAGLPFPFPTINVNLKVGKGVVFGEVSGNPVLVMSNFGYEYPFTQRTSFYLAKTAGGTIGSQYSGYKLGYVYNSNEFNKSGWITSIELYSVTHTEDHFAFRGKGGNKFTFPSISVGYQW